MTPLAAACVQSHCEIVRFLLANGADITRFKYYHCFAPAIQKLLAEHQETLARRAARAAKRVARRTCACGQQADLAEKALRVCSACRTRRYCSEECQRVDWYSGDHRSRCPHLGPE